MREPDDSFLQDFKPEQSGGGAPAADRLPGWEEWEFDPYLLAVIAE